MKRAESTECLLLVDIRNIQGTESSKKLQNTVVLFGADAVGEARESFQMLNFIDLTSLSFGGVPAS